MKIKIMLASLAVASIGVTYAATAFADNRSSSERDVPLTEVVDATSHLRLAATPLELADQGDWTAIHDLLLEDRNGDITWGPIKSELKSATEGRVLIKDEDGRRLAAIPTTRGDVCFVAGRGTEGIARGCYPTLGEAGVAVTMLTSSLDRPDEAFGFADADVDSIVVRTKSGKSYPVAVSNGAFWWTAPNDTDRVASVESHRDGAKHVERMPSYPGA